MCPKRSLQNKIVVLALALVLVVPILVACGKAKEQTPLSTPTPAATPSLTTTPAVTLTPTPVATPGPTTTPAVTLTPRPTGPVKIGAIGPWSGPMGVAGMLADQAISVVEKQVKNMGGILGGREIKFVRADDRGVVAESAAQAKKLILDDKISILTLGGVSVAHMTAVAEVAEEYKVPFVALGTIYGVEAMKYSALLYSNEVLIARAADFIADVVKPKTVAFLGYESEDTHGIINGVRGVVGARERWKAAGLDLIYEQYFPQDAMDFSPYLTKIKYLNPDLVIIATNNLAQDITINKQIIELGGWGDMKVWHSNETSSGQKAVSMPAALGTYVSVLWMPGSDDPGMKAFEDAFKKTWGRLATNDLAYYYNCFWAGIKAIELAGTSDREKVAQAMRSGNLEWDSAWGHLRIPPDGKGMPTLMVAQVQEGGKLVKVWP